MPLTDIKVKMAKPEVSKIFAISLEALFGEEASKPAGKRGPSPKWQQHMEEIDALPKARQKMIAEMLSTMIARPQE